MQTKLNKWSIDHSPAGLNPARADEENQGGYLEEKKKG